MIIEMMSMIAERVEEAVECFAEFAYILFWALVFVVLIVTCPIWILPFLVGRRIYEIRSERTGEEHSEQDC